MPPPLIGREAARELARRELAKPVYQQAPTSRILAKISSFLGRLFAHMNSAVPGGWWALVILAALVALVAAAVLTRAGPRRRAAAAAARISVDSARDHRERAELSASAGNWAGAIRERMRAISRELEERAILPPRAGRTADELAAEAGATLAAYATGLRSAARLFDDVHYGQRPGTKEGYAQLRDLDEGIRTARLAGSP